MKGRHFKNDLKGKIFGCLTVIEPDNTKPRHSKYWRCKCECGNEIIVARNHLLNGYTKSCGHLKIQSGYEHLDNFDENNKLNAKYKTNLLVIVNNKKPPNNTSGIKGVNYHKSRKLWRGRIIIHRKEICKWFKYKKDAIKWRKNAEKEYFEPIINEAIKNGDLKK